jgi:hypothetical protein
MGSQWVEDPSWGNIFSGIAKNLEAAPGEALSNIAKAEQIKQARVKAAREQQQWDAGVKASGGLDAAVPQAYVPPTDYSTVGPFTGDANDPGATAGLPTVDLQYTDPRAQALAEARRKLAIAGGQATILKDPSQWASQLGYGSVAAAGVPKTADERAQTQFMTTGKFPTAEERAAPAAHNLAIIGPNGQPTGRSIATQDFKTEAISGRPIQSLVPPGHTVLATGPASTTPANPFGTGTDAVALQSLEKIRQDSAARGHMTPEEAQLASKLFDVAYPPSRVTETEGGRLVEKQIRAKPIPPSMMPMFQLTQDYAQGRHLQLQQQPGQPPPVQDLTLDRAPQPEQTDPNASRVVRMGPQSAAELRKEITNTQSFSDYSQAIPSYNVMVKAAQGDARTGMPTSASDLNIIYAVAKLFDPGSVVREGELKLAAGTAPIADQLTAAYNRLFTGEGSLTPEIRANLIAEGLKRMEVYQQAKDVTANWYTDIVKKQGLDPAEIIPPLIPLLPYSREAIQNPQVPGQPRPQQPRSVDDIVNGR